MKTLTLTAADRDLAFEYRDHPTAPHGPRLQHILNVLRGGPLAGKYVLYNTVPHREWLLARQTGEREAPLEVFKGCKFTSLAEAEWEVFKLRWTAHGGPALAGETVVRPGAASPVTVANQPQNGPQMLAANGPPHLPRKRPSTPKAWMRSL